MAYRRSPGKQVRRIGERPLSQPLLHDFGVGRVRDETVLPKPGSCNNPGVVGFPKRQRSICRMQVAAGVDGNAYIAWLTDNSTAGWAVYIASLSIRTGIVSDSRFSVVRRFELVAGGHDRDGVSRARSGLRLLGSTGQPEWGQRRDLQRDREVRGEHGPGQPGRRATSFTVTRFLDAWRCGRDPI